MKPYSIKKFPKTRIATIDLGKVGWKRSHIPVLLKIAVAHSQAKNQGF